MRHLVAFLLAPVAVFAAEGWLTDLDAAKKQAAAEKKDILVDFTGSDWCGWCIKLDKEVFNTPAFKAQKDFVLVYLDFPRDKEIPADQKAKNDALSKAWGIQGFPTIILANAQGEPYAQTGYKPGGPEAYLAHLRELKKQNTPEGIKALAAEREERVALSKQREARGAKMRAAIAAKDFNAAAQIIEENFPADMPNRLLAVKLNQAGVSMQIDPENKARALGLLEEAAKAAEGNERALKNISMMKERINKQGAAPATK
jgi:thioredoxin-related protein